MTHKIVRRYHVAVPLLWAVAGGVIGLIGGYLLFNIELSQANNELVKLHGGDSDRRKEVQQLKQGHDEFRNANDLLRDENATLRQKRRIDQEVHEMMQLQLQNLQELNSKLQEELIFFRGIMVPDGDSSGLAIRGMQIFHQHGARFRLSMLLTKVPNDGLLSKGSLEVDLVSDVDGTTQRYSLHGLTREEDVPLPENYRFKYFQTIISDFNLPESFTPIKVMVRLLPNKKGKKEIVQVFDWTVEELM